MLLSFVNDVRVGGKSAAQVGTTEATTLNNAMPFYTWHTFSLTRGTLSHYFAPLQRLAWSLPNFTLAPCLDKYLDFFSWTGGMISCEGSQTAFQQQSHSTNSMEFSSSEITQRSVSIGRHLPIVPTSTKNFIQLQFAHHHNFAVVDGLFQRTKS